MNNKKTIILTFSLATILILGILVFSNGVQNAWQATSEVENNIDVSNGNNILLASNIDYPYDSIKNADAITYFDTDDIKSSTVSLITDSNDSMLPLQDTSNYMGEFIKLYYGSTQPQKSTAYTDYISKNSNTFTFYTTFLNSDTSNLRIYSYVDSLTGKPFSIQVDNFSTLSDSYITTTDTNTYNLTLTENEKIRIADATKHILNILGYSSEISNQEYQVNGGFQVYENKLIYEDKNLPSSLEDVSTLLIYSSYISLNDGTELVIEFFANSKELELFRFSNIASYENYMG